MSPSPKPLKPPKRITLDLIPHSEQRYNTVGDWYFDPDDPEHLLIKGSELRGSATPWLQWAVPLHEAFEALASLAAGIGPEVVDEFDKTFELMHADDDKEPGDDPFCPIHRQHKAATRVEKLFVTKMLGCDWENYLDALDKPYLDRRRRELRSRKEAKA